MDIDRLLRPISESSPCGPDLEFDPRVSEFRSACQPVIDRNTGTPGDPNWRQAIELGEALLLEFKHIEVAYDFLRALAATNGWPGLVDGLTLLHGLVARFWDDVFPLDREDPVYTWDLRKTFFTSLNLPPSLVMIGRLPLVQHMGDSYGRKDHDDAKEGKSEDPACDRLILATFEAVSTADHQARLAQIDQCLSLVEQLDAFLTEKVPSRSAISLSPFKEAIEEAKAVLNPYALVAAEGSGSSEAIDGDFGSGGGPLASGPIGAINSRRAAVEALDKIIEFFERAEPASPLPLLLRRAKRCVGLNFMALLDELTIPPEQAITIFKPDDIQAPSGGSDG